MAVISASSKKYATIFRLLMETGVMPFELANVSLKDIDLDKGTLVSQRLQRTQFEGFQAQE
jgi:integrase